MKRFATSIGEACQCCWRAEIFGSRARGDFSHGSDIDLAVYHNGMSSEYMNRLRMDLDDLPIIYRIDVVDPKRVSRLEFAASIARDGVVYTNDCPSANDLPPPLPRSRAWKAGPGLPVNPLAAKPSPENAKESACQWRTTR